MSDLVLELSGVTKSYNAGTPRAVDVLRGVDLAVKRGEIVALVAPSGAGKSTLLHMAGLLDTPDAGQVSIGGKEMTKLSDRRRTGARGDRACRRACAVRERGARPGRRGRPLNRG